MKAVFNRIGGWRGVAYRLGVAALVACAAAITGCGMVDSESSHPAENNVANYYTLLQKAGVTYRYTTNYISSNATVADTLVMNMKGLDEQAADPTAYECDWVYSQNTSNNSEWYYTLSHSIAVDRGGKYKDYWVDLEGTLQKGSTWSFTRPNGEVVTAKVDMYGVAASVNQVHYDDVVMVSYTGSKGTSGTKWFARGVGIIYARVNFGTFTVEDSFESRTMN